MPWHNLRHPAATTMFAQGVADIYGHVSPETNRQAADAMAKALR
jgi:hypothetical protein